MAPSIPEKIDCHSVADLRREIRDACLILDQTETEDNWEKMAHALARLSAVTRGGGYKMDEFVPAFKPPLSSRITSCMASERTRLSGAAVDLITAFGPRLGSRFEPLVQFYVPTLLSLTTRTNKIYISRAHTCLCHIVTTSRLPAIVHLLREAVKDKSHTLRIAATDLTVTFIEAWRDMCEDEVFRKARWVEDVESIIRFTAKDANPVVRKSSRSTFDLYKVMWPDRLDGFTSPLTPVMRRYLDIDSSNLSGKPSSGSSQPKLKSVKSFASLSSHSARQPVTSLPSDSVLAPSRPTRLPDHPHRSVGSSAVVLAPTRIQARPPLAPRAESVPTAPERATRTAVRRKHPAPSSSSTIMNVLERTDGLLRLASASSTYYSQPAPDLPMKTSEVDPHPPRPNSNCSELSSAASTSSRPIRLPLPVSNPGEPAPFRPVSRRIGGGNGPPRVDASDVGSVLTSAYNKPQRILVVRPTVREKLPETQTRRPLPPRPKAGVAALEVQGEDQKRLKLGSSTASTSAQASATSTRQPLVSKLSRSHLITGPVGFVPKRERGEGLMGLTTSQRIKLKERHEEIAKVQAHRTAAASTKKPASKAKPELTRADAAADIPLPPSPTPRPPTPVIVHSHFEIQVAPSLDPTEESSADSVKPRTVNTVNSSEIVDPANCRASTDSVNSAIYVMPSQPQAVLASEAILQAASDLPLPWDGAPGLTGSETCIAMDGLRCVDVVVPVLPVERPVFGEVSTNIQVL